MYSQQRWALQHCCTLSSQQQLQFLKLKQVSLAWSLSGVLPERLMNYTVLCGSRRQDGESEDIFILIQQRDGYSVVLLWQSFSLLSMRLWDTRRVQQRLRPLFLLRLVSISYGTPSYCHNKAIGMIGQTAHVCYLVTNQLGRILNDSLREAWSQYKQIKHPYVCAVVEAD